MPRPPIFSTCIHVYYVHNIEKNCDGSGDEAMLGSHVVIQAITY